MRQLLFFSLLFLIPILGISQSGEVYHKVFTKQDGLELDNILTMCFDDDGFIWLGGRNLEIRTIILGDKKLALQRFNGSTFHSFPLPEREDPITGVGQIYKRSDGKFYIRGRSRTHHLFLFDPISVKFEEVKFEEAKSIAFSLSHVFSYEDKDYILSQSGREIILNIINEDLSLEPLFRFTSEGNKYRLDDSTRFIANKKYCLIGDDNFPMVAFDWTGKVLKRYSSLSFSRERIANLDKFYINETFYKGDSCFAFMHNKPNLFYLDEKTIELKPSGIPNTELNSSALKTYNDPLGNNLIAYINNEGLNFNVLTSKGFVTTYRSKVLENSSALNILSTNLKEDLWLATFNNELHYFKFPPDKVKKHLSNSGIRAIQAFDAHHYIIATEGDGWYLMNKKTKTLQPYTITENGRRLKPSSSRNFFREGDTLWSHDGGYILKIDVTTKIAEAFRHYPVICMERPNDTTIVYGTNGYHLMEFNTKTKEHRSLAVTDSLFIYDIAIHNDLVVGATDKGILTYDLKSTKRSFMINQTDLMMPSS